jgi:activator of 2-hydroxyglutaryl-CoA dehydratase
MKRRIYLGVDVGSVSTNLVVIDERGVLLEKLYQRSEGNPIKSVQSGVAKLAELIMKSSLLGVGVTGSGRQLIGRILGADLVKNEITAHGMAGLSVEPTVKTIIEIGGQDSKLILLREGTVIDFAMNTVCAAGTGSPLQISGENCRPVFGLCRVGYGS